MKKRFCSQPVDLGHGFKVEFSWRKDGIYCEWEPEVPGPDKLNLLRLPYQLALWNFVGARLTRFVGDTGVVVTEIR